MHPWLRQTQAIMCLHFRSRTRKWISFRLRQINFFDNLPRKRLNSWSSLVLWAGLTTYKQPRFSSLQMLPAAEMNQVEALVATLKASVGPLPVTEQSLKRYAELYLPWLYQMLTEYEAAAAAGQEHPRMYTILPQISDSLSFITISNSSLHRYEHTLNVCTSSLSCLALLKGLTPTACKSILTCRMMRLTSHPIASTAACALPLCTQPAVTHNNSRHCKWYYMPGSHVRLCLSPTP